MRKKRVGIDMRMMKPFPTGIGSHYIHLIHNVIQNNPEREYILIINKRSEKIVKQSFKDVTVTYAMININGGSFKQYLLIPYLYIAFFSLHLDLLITDIWSCFIIFPVPYLLMVYDLIGFHHIVPVSLKQSLFDQYIYYWAVKFAKRIIASGTSVKQDLLYFLHVNPKKIAIVMPSVAEEYMQLIDEEEANIVINKYGLVRNNYVIYVGNRREHKNLLGALKIMSKVHQNEKNIMFAVIGGVDAENDTQKPIEEIIKDRYPNLIKKVKFLGKIPNNTTVQLLLHGSRALLHPSLFEGYGLTPLEAMYAATPAIVSNIPSIKEVVDSAGILYPPTDIKGFVSAIELLKDADIRDKYIEKGIKRAKEITWKKAAETFESAIRDVL